jgi:hypothetical protein
MGIKTFSYTPKKKPAYEGYRPPSGALTRRFSPVPPRLPRVDSNLRALAPREKAALQRSSAQAQAVRNRPPKPGKDFPSRNFTPADAKRAFVALSSKYSPALLKLVERMFRLETANFTSGQYVATGSAGQVSGKWKGMSTDPPFKYFWHSADAERPSGWMKFIIWPDVESALEYLCEYIIRYKGNWTRWNSNIPNRAELYANKVLHMQSPFMDAIIQGAGGNLKRSVDAIFAAMHRVPVPNLPVAALNKAPALVRV